MWKTGKNCIPKPHVQAFYILNFRWQIAIPRTQNGAQIPHPRVILGDHMALDVLVTDGHDFPLKFLLINLTKTQKFFPISPNSTLPIRRQIHGPLKIEKLRTLISTMLYKRNICLVTRTLIPHWFNYMYI